MKTREQHKQLCVMKLVGRKCLWQEAKQTEGRVNIHVLHDNELTSQELRYTTTA